MEKSSGLTRPDFYSNLIHFNKEFNRKRFWAQQGKQGEAWLILIDFWLILIDPSLLAVSSLIKINQQSMKIYQNQSKNKFQSTNSNKPHSECSLLAGPQSTSRIHGAPPGSRIHGTPAGSMEYLQDPWSTSKIPGTLPRSMEPPASIEHIQDPWSTWRIHGALARSMESQGKPDWFWLIFDWFWLTPVCWLSPF